MFLKSSGQVMKKLSTSIFALELPVAENIGDRQNLLFQQFQAFFSIISRPIIAIRKMERINIPFMRIILFLNHFQKKFIGRGDNRSATFTCMKKSLLINFASNRIVNNIPNIHTLFVL